MLTQQELERRESNWDSVARERGYRCLICSTQPAAAEKITYYLTGMCAHHAETCYH